MLRIGQFAWLNQVTTETLRHYDRLGLLKPAQIDQATSYRYYSLEQMARLNRILALKDAGLPLSQIASLLDEALPPDKVCGMLRLKQAQLESQMAELKRQLIQVQTRLDQIEMEGKMPDYEVVLKTVEAQRVAAMRTKVPNYAAVGPSLVSMLDQIGTYVATLGQQIGHGITLWYDNDDPDHKKETEIEIEAAITLEGAVGDDSAITVYDLPGHLMACTVHRGSFSGLSTAKRAVFAWVEANDYQIIGPIREVYLHLQYQLANPADYMTEIQFPVKKQVSVGIEWVV